MDRILCADFNVKEETDDDDDGDDDDNDDDGFALHCQTGCTICSPIRVKQTNEVSLNEDRFSQSPYCIPLRVFERVNPGHD